MEDELQTEATEEEQARQPTRGHVRPSFTTIDVLCIGGIVVATVRSLVTLFIGPSLIGSHPVLLEVLRGSTSSMITAGAFAREGNASLPVAVLSGVVGLGFFSVFYWWAGRRYGNRVLEFYTKQNPRYERWVGRSERFLARFGGPVLIVQYYQPIPNVLFYLGTGASGLPLWQFLLFNTIGCLLWVGMAVALGYWIGTPAVHVAKEISHYSLYATIAIFVVVVVLAYRRALRMQQQADQTRDDGPTPEAG